MKTKTWTAQMILRFRNRHNLSQKEFSDLIGCRQQTISEWELELYSPGNAYCKVLTFLEKQMAKKEPIQIQ